MSFSRPSGAPPSGGWSPYRGPRQPGDGRRRRRLLIAAVVGAILVAGVLAGVLIPRGGGTAGASGFASRYAALSDATVQRCPPDRTAVATFNACIGRFRDGLARLRLPAAEQGAEQNVDNIVQLLQTCTATPDHDDPGKRDWGAGCPQQGPTTVADAEAQDEQFRSQYFGMLLSADDTLRSQLGAPAVPATP